MRLAAALAALLVLAGCGAHRADDAAGNGWVTDEVSFTAGGLTLFGSYRHLSGGGPGPAALLISESGATDRNGDNNVAGPIGNMRQLAEYLSEHGVASLRYDKVGTGATGLGPFADRPGEVGSAVYTDGARAAVGFLAGQPDVDDDRVSVYAVGEGTVHAMALAADPAAPPIHSLALLQPLSARYLDLISGRVADDLEAAVQAGAKTTGQAQAVTDAWRAAVAAARAGDTVPADLPDGLSAILNPGNVKAVTEADAIDPLELAARIPAGTPVLLTCSDSDGQADCADVRALAAALAHTDLQFVELSGVNHVLRDDPTDDITRYASGEPLSGQLIAALDGFVDR